MTYLQGFGLVSGRVHQATLISFIKPPLYHKPFKCVCFYILSVFLEGCRNESKDSRMK